MSTNPFVVIMWCSVAVLIGAFLKFFVWPRFDKKHSSTVNVKGDRGKIYLGSDKGLMVVDKIEKLDGGSKLKIFPKLLDGTDASSIDVLRADLIITNPGQPYEFWMQSSAGCKKCNELTVLVRQETKRADEYEADFRNLQHNFDKRLKDAIELAKPKAPYTPGVGKPRT